MHASSFFSSARALPSQHHRAARHQANTVNPESEKPMPTKRQAVNQGKLSQSQQSTTAEKAPKNRLFSSVSRLLHMPKFCH